MMNSSNESGRKVCVMIGIYLIVKTILNMVLGGGLSILGIIIAAAEIAVLYIGIQYTNYIAAALLVLVALVHLPDNISNISSNWIYLAEGIADIACAAVLVTKSDVKEHFTSVTIDDLINK